MRLLLDTHIGLWALTADKRLSAEARALIGDPDNLVYISVVSVWEIAIKHGLGRASIPFSGADAVRYFAEAGYEWLDIRPQHAAAVETLPMLHADPFDRLLVAQALIEPLRLITHDPMVAAYTDTILLV